MERLLACLLVLTLTGCAHGEYWVPIGQPVEVKHVVRVDFPCKKFDIDGCWNEKANTVEIKKGLKERENCIINHERKHAAGYTHENRKIVYVSDCGDGTMM